MPNRITMDGILPVIWTNLELDPGEQTRSMSRPAFERIMKTTETIVSPTVLKRMWETLLSSDYANRSPYAGDVAVLNVGAIRLRLAANGLTSLVANTQTTHTAHTRPESGRWPA